MGIKYTIQQRWRRVVRSRVLVSRYYRSHYKVTATVVVVLLILAIGILSETITPFLKQDRYNLSENAQKIIGKSWDAHEKYLKLNDKKDGYAFDATVLLAESQQGDAHAGTVMGAYNANFPLDTRKGITVTDNVSKIDITLTPRFPTYSGEEKDGHIIYPLFNHNAQLVYSLKYNGLKEDIVLPQFIKDQMSFEFDLKLPSGLEARLENTGDIGVYSADRTLFGNISYGSDSDRELVEKAKANGAKSNKVFTIPAPLIKDGRGNTHRENIRFGLKDNVLTISADHLEGQAYPLSLDPTITVASAGNFNRATLDHNIDINTTDGTLTRAPLTGGGINSWTTERSLPATTMAPLTTTYNGSLYVAGGWTTVASTTVYRSIIDPATGDLGTYTNLNQDIPTDPVSGKSGRWGGYLEAHNGFLYMFGGAGGDLGTDAIIATFYAPINPDGTIGAWINTGQNLANQSFFGSSFLYNSRLYAVNEGTTDLGNTSKPIQYATIRADGTISAWSYTTDFPGWAYGMAFAQYEGRVYATGGYQAGFIVGQDNIDNEVWSAPIDPVTGAIGTFIAEGNMPSTRGGHQMFAFRGYMYITGGCNVMTFVTVFWPGGTATCATPANTTYYAQILANGRLGNWVQTTDPGVGVIYNSRAKTDDYMYTIGGCEGDTDNDLTLGICYATQVATVRRIETIAPAGDIQTPLNDNNITARTELASVVLNGNLYVIGGCTSVGDQCTGSSTLVEKAAIIAGGEIGAYTTSSIAALPAARGRLAATVANNTIYVVAGCSGTNCTTVANNTYYAKPNADGTITAWSNDTTNPLNTPRYYHSLVAYNGYIYAVGGYNGTNALATVEYAQINTGGDLAAWNFTSVAMPNTRSSAAAATYAGRIYVTGGRDGATIRNSIDWATIGSNGNITSWSTDSTNPFTTARFGHATEIMNGYIYIFAGDNNTTELNDIQFAPINDDGTVGAFSTSIQTIANTRAYVTSTTSGGTIYVIGGCRNYDETNARCAGTLVADTRTVYVNNGGQGIVTPAVQDADKMTRRAYHVTLVLNGYIYVIGGCTSATGCSGTLGNVQKAAINTNDGTIGAWSNTTSQLAAARQRGSGFVYKGRLYVVGGYTNAASTTTTTTVEYITPQSSGDLTGGWTVQTSAIPTAWTEFDLAVYDGYVYRAGGNTGSGKTDTTEKAPINADGSLGAWTSEDNLSGGEIRNNQVVAAHGTLYSLGGYHDVTGHSNTVEYARIDPSTHEIGAWSKTTSFNIARDNFFAEAYNGYLIIGGGSGIIGAGSDELSDMQQASISADGSLSNWTFGRSLTQGAMGSSSAIYAGYFYVTGGYDTAAQSTDDLQYMTIDTQPRAAAFSWVFDFDLDVRPDVITAAGYTPGTTDFLLGFVYGMAPSATSIYTTTQTALNVSHKATLTRVSSMSGARYLFAQIRFGDRPEDAVYPDKPTKVSKFSVYFVPDPNKRLRNGRTFTEERNEFYNKTDLNRGLNATPQ